MTKTRKTSRSWGGRFKAAPDTAVQEFTASIRFDIRLSPYDIRTSIAHANMLASCGILRTSERGRIVGALRRIGEEIREGRFRPRISDEDIHMAIERRLIEKIGSTGAKLHAARSRNDQVVTDVRLYCKDAIAEIEEGIGGLEKALIEVAAEHSDVVMPGYTHLQRAQPILLGHHLLAYHDMIERDRARLLDCLDRVDILPLGAGALAGTTLPIDRKLLARELGFAKVAANSIDAVADRDFIAELLAGVAILFAHLSRLAGEITMWASSEFGFVSLDDAYSTGSSMMPQKRNPDIAELVRGKAGRTYGNLVAVLTTLKGLPLAYNSDLQEDKEPLFDSVDTAKASLSALAALLRSLSFETEAMAAAANDGMLLATDLAEHLVGEGVPFRQAHEITGRIVGHCLDRGLDLRELSLEELRRFCPRFGDGVKAILSIESAVRRRRSAGGTSPANLKRRLRRLQR